MSTKSMDRCRTEAVGNVERKTIGEIHVRKEYSVATAKARTMQLKYVGQEEIGQVHLTQEVVGETQGVVQEAAQEEEAIRDPDNRYVETWQSCKRP